VIFTLIAILADKGIVFGYDPYFNLKMLDLLIRSSTILLLIDRGYQARAIIKSALNIAGINNLAKGGKMKKMGLFLALAILSLSVSLNGYCAKEGNVSESKVLFQSASDSFRKGDIPAAIKQYSKIIANGSENADAYGGLGNCYYSKGDVSKALEYFNKAVALDSKNSFALSGLGNCYLQTDSGKSKEYYKKAIAANDKDPWAYFHLGSVYSREKNKDGALQQLKILTTLGNKDLESQLRKQITLDNP